MSEATLPRRTGVRARLAIGLAVTTLLVAALVAIAAAAFGAWQGTDEADPQVGAARIGDDVVVIVTEEDPGAAADARSAALRWSLIALGLSVIPAVAVGWFVAGRMLTTVDTALAEVEAAEDDRERRLQEVVHELRTPLAVMGTNLELAASDADTASESAGFIDAALRALDRMDRTIDDLATNGELAVDATKDPVDVAAVATAVVDEYAGPAHRRGIHLITAGSDAVTAGSAEPAPLRTVLGNLVANAVRLAPSGSVVAVDWGVESDWAWIAVTDEGPGLPPRHHARVFERGWRGPHERHRGDDGEGLGLTIARQLTEAQGGELTLTSAEGSGSSFTVWLPRTTDADATAVVADDGVHPAVTPWREHVSS